MQKKHLDIKNLIPWALLHTIDLNGITVEDVGRAGTGVRLTKAKHNATNPIMTIPSDMILSQQGAFVEAKSDSQLRDLLLANEAFSQNARGAIIMFLILQLSRTSQNTETQIGHKGMSPWCAYVQFLSPVPLPTCWEEYAIDSLSGTSLFDATTAKLKSLNKEFQHFRTVTQDLEWCQKEWWDEENITFEDWVLVDAWYRSRVLELPNQGPCMVPMLDFCNHGTNANARYDMNNDGDVTLLLTETLEDGAEIFINYGKDKSAAEMAFSYGFIEDDRQDASQISLNLINTGAGDDVFTLTKQRLLTSAPILKISRNTHSIEWTSEYIWLLSVNQEDGFNIRVLQENDGTKHLQAFWFDDVLQVEEMQSILRMTDQWPVYKLRAVFLVKGRIQEQLLTLESLDDMQPSEHSFMNNAWHVIGTLRKLEKLLLNEAKVELEVQEAELYELPVVREYLSAMHEIDDPQLQLDDDDDDEEDLT